MNLGGGILEHSRIISLVLVMIEDLRSGFTESVE